jgi:hypothetical protein
VARSAGLVEDDLIPGLRFEVEQPEVAEVVLRREQTGPVSVSTSKTLKSATGSSFGKVPFNPPKM